MRGRARPWAAFALLAVVVGALYAPSLGHPFLFDDAVQIVENPAVTRGARLRDYFFDRETTSARADYNTRIYRPLRNLGFRAIARAAGVRAIAFELASLILYAAAIALVIALALRLFGGDRAAAAIAGVLFALMPVHVEAVCYPSAFGDQLSCVLELGALVAAWGALDDKKTSARALALGAASVALALGAMLAKEMAVTEGGLLVLVVGMRALKRRRGFLLIAAHGAITIGYLALRTAVLGRVGQDDVTRATVAAGLRDAPVLLVEYARLAAAPLGHRAAYVVPPPSLLEAVAALAAIAAAFAVAVYARVRRAALGLGWFALALLPVLHVVPLWADLADRFVLVPSAGLAFAAAALYRRFATAPEKNPALEKSPAPEKKSAQEKWANEKFADGKSPNEKSAAEKSAAEKSADEESAAEKFPDEIVSAEAKSRGELTWRRRRLIAFAIVAAIALAFAGGVLVEERNWASDDALWTHAAREEPRSALAQANLGAVALGAGRFEEALAALDRARALGRESGELELRRAQALDALGRAADAEAAVARALALDPALGRAWALDGDLLRRRARLDDAEAALAHARALAPDHPSTALLAAALAESRGRSADAAFALADLATRYPSPRFHYLHGAAALRAGDAPRAEAAARACLALDAAARQCDGLLGRALVAIGAGADEARAANGSRAYEARTAGTSTDEARGDGTRTDEARVDEARAALDRALAALPDGPDRAACAAARATLR